MDRQEAIEILTAYRKSAENTYRVNEDTGTVVGHTVAFDMAIEALSQPIVCKDYCIDDDHIYCSPKTAHRVVEALKDRLNGEWIAEEEYGDLWVCDQCGFASEHNDSFCPNCGAKMDKE